MYLGSESQEQKKARMEKKPERRRADSGEQG